MMKKRIRAEVLKAVFKLPEDIQDDDVLEVSIRKVDEVAEAETQERKLSYKDLVDLFNSRIRACSPESYSVEEIFSLDEVDWRDLNEAMVHFEEEGYGVKIKQQGERVQMKILWRYV
ncbi:MAG: hypothetical protein GX833_01275 [Clostridium sp.]|nr:hypothetical protein [Clostridium sp.]